MSHKVMSTLPKRITTFGMICAATLAISACQTLGGSAANTAVPAPSASASAQLAAVQEVFDASADQVPTLTLSVTLLCPLNPVVRTRRSV